MPSRTPTARRPWLFIWAVCVLSATSVLGQGGWGGGSGPSGPLGPLGPAPNTLTLGNGDLTLVLAKGATSYDVQSITSSATGSMTFEPGGLWSLTMHTAAGDQVLVPANFATTQVATATGGYMIQWSNQSVIPGNVVVKALIRFQSGAFDFQIWVNNSSTTRALRNVRFPIIRIQPLTTEFLGEVLMLPLLGGGGTFLFPETLPSLQFPNPGTSTQLFSLFERLGNRVLYWQTKDILGTHKEYRVQGLGGSTLFEVINFPVNNHLAGSDYSPLYSFSLTALSGTWFDAGVRYRQWATQQPWALRGRIETSSWFTPRMKALELEALMYPNHLVGFNDFDAFTADAIRIRDFLGLQPDELALLWSDWGANVFNTVEPDTLPARSTASGAVGAAHAAGIRVLPYVMIDFWSPNSTNYAAFNVANYAWTDIDGNVPVSFLGPDVSTLVFPHIRLDPALSGTRTAEGGILNQVLGALGTQSWDGLYLDTWSGQVPELDYNPQLPLKGGTPLWSLGRTFEGLMFQQLVKGPDPDRFLTSEAPNETVVSVIDLVHYNPFENGIVQLPIWETVYHGYIYSSNLGATVPQQPLAFQEAVNIPNITYDFHLGKILGLSNYFADVLPYIHPDPMQNQGIETFEYVRSLIQVDRFARKYRVFGEMLRPLSSSVPTSLLTGAYFAQPRPTAFTSIWKASTGEIGILATNDGSASAFADVTLSFSTYGLTGSWDLFANLGGTRVLVGTFSGSLSIPVPLGPRSAFLLELVPH